MQLSTSAAASTRFIPANDNGVMIEEHPRIKRMLNTLEPRILPRASWSLCLAAEDESCQAGCDCKKGKGHIHLLLPFGICLLLGIKLEAVPEVAGEYQQKDCPLDPGYGIGAAKAEESAAHPAAYQKKRDEHGNGDIPPAVRIRHRDGHQECRKTKDEESIEYVGTDDIPDGDVGIPLNCSSEAHYELRTRCPEAHDSETYDKFADSGSARYGGGPVNKPVCAEDYEPQADQQQ